MSLYRFVRLTAVLALLRRYRARLLRLVFLVSLAVVTAWQYADVAVYMQQHHPELSGWVLVIKTAIVYAALFWGFWEVGRMVQGDDGLVKPAIAPTQAAASTPDTPLPSRPSPLDQLADKPSLRSRKSDILDSTSKAPRR